MELLGDTASLIQVGIEDTARDALARARQSGQVALFDDSARADIGDAELFGCHATEPSDRTQEPSDGAR